MIDRTCRFEPSTRSPRSTWLMTTAVASEAVRRSRARAVIARSPRNPSGRAVSIVDVLRIEPGRRSMVAGTGSLGPLASGRQTTSVLRRYCARRPGSRPPREMGPDGQGTPTAEVDPFGWVSALHREQTPHPRDTFQFELSPFGEPDRGSDYSGP